MDVSEPVAVPEPQVQQEPNPVTLTGIEKIWLLPLKGREEEAGKVSSHLIGLGVCVRCVFRVLKLKEIKFYREDLKVRI